MNENNRSCSLKVSVGHEMYSPVRLQMRKVHFKLQLLEETRTPGHVPR